MKPRSYLVFLSKGRLTDPLNIDNVLPTNHRPYYMLLDIKNLHASIGDKPILKGINLQIRKGEVHSIMGPNGSGKSTLSSVLVGNRLLLSLPALAGYCGCDLLARRERSHQGLFLGFQYPVEIPESR